MKKFLAFVLVCAMALLMTGCSTSDSGKTPTVELTDSVSQQETTEENVQETVQETAQEPAAGFKDPDLFKTMQTVDLSGNPVDASTFAKNKVTLVNVWNTGCTPCIMELSTLDTLNKEYEGKGAAIRGLYHSFSPEISEAERTEIAEIMEAEGAEYPQWQMSQAMLDTETFTDWSFFPGTFIVDSEGNILDMLEGSRDYEGWKSVIEDALTQVDGNA